jgi:glycosyltransferase involved in cell wall biosynthesis
MGVGAVEIYIYASSSVDLAQYISPTTLGRATIIRSSMIDNRYTRVFFEQIILPFYCREIDVLFSPNNANPIILQLFKKTKKTICTIHDLTWIKCRNKYSSIQFMYLMAITYLQCKLSTSIFTVSENSRNDILLYFKPRCRVINVANAFEYLRGQLSINNRKSKIYISISTVHPSKNPELTIDGFIEAKKSGFLPADSEFYWLGKINMDISKIEKKINDEGQQNYVKFLGYVTNDEKFRIIGVSKCLVMLSLYEGFGIPVVEAFSRSIPVIVSNTSSLSEIGGSAAIFADPLSIESISDAFKNLEHRYDSLRAAAQIEWLKFGDENITKKFFLELLYVANLKDDD